MTDAFKFPRNSNRFIAAIVIRDEAETDPDLVAVTKEAWPPPSGDPLWVAPQAGTIRGVARVGVTTGGRDAETKYHVWAVATDPDEFAPVLAATFFLE